MSLNSETSRSAKAESATSQAALRVRAHWLVSLLLVALSAAGFWLFSRGFLLTRMVLPDHSLPSVLPFQSAPGTPESVGPDAALASEWYPAKYERAIILVVDALRVDFAMWSDELNSTFGTAGGVPGSQHIGRLMPYHNRLPAIAALSRERPDQSMLYRFRADPPTTTLQRLKGLTTGQLPTFIDAGSNFAGSTVDEDNWLQALRRPPIGIINGTKAARSHNLVFLGDDTWISMFPNELSDTQATETNDTLQKSRTGWARVRPFPSLNVWDLDTVDDGVLSRLPMFLLPPESENKSEIIRKEREQWRQLVKQPHMWEHSDFNEMTQANSMVSDKVGHAQLHHEWDMIIAHGLGVDHCGHRFGPDHSAISHKLAQMNTAIELIVNAIDRNDKPTALYVFGDHGMDNKGDHGGDSPREVDAGLWIYSNRKWHSKESDERTARVLRNAQELISSNALGSSFDQDLKESWWRNTHLSDDYKSASGEHLFEAPELRSVSQIDLVSTLSLSLGLPIPFNNLGTAIPEMFASDNDSSAEWGLLSVLRLNAAQVLRYIEKYVSNSRSHGFTDDALRLWNDMYNQAEDSYRELADAIGQNPKNRRQPHIRELEERVAAEYFAFTRMVLGSLRQMWAQFDPVLILAGLGTLVLSIAALLALYAQSRLRSLDIIIARAGWPCISGGIAGAVVFRALSSVFVSSGLSHMTSLDATVAGLAMGAAATFCVALVSDSKASTFAFVPQLQWLAVTPATVLNVVAAVATIIHCLAFSSNSFTFNEDSIVLYTVQTLVLATSLLSVRAILSSSAGPKRASGTRALVCSLLILVLNRTLAYSTVCREEQLSACTPTFYGAPSASISTVYLAAANVVMVWLVPSAVTYALRRSYSDRAMVSKLWVSLGMRVSMGMAAAYWVLDSIDGQTASGAAAASSPTRSLAVNGSDWSDMRMALARMAAGVALGGGLAAWYASPFCLDVELPNVPILSQPQALPTNKGASRAPAGQSQRTAVILGYGNAYGAAYLIFVTVVFCVLFLVQQPMGGIMLSLLFIELILCVELFDALRDTIEEASSLLCAQVILMAQLSYVGYFATGHQFTLVSIQWSTAFVGVREMQLVVCGIIVALNTLGSFVLTAACMPLAVLWNESLGTQLLRLAPDNYISRITGAGAAYAAYHAVVSVSSAACAAWFRRHLMVWKIFAPRFMFSVPITLVSSAVLLLVAIGLATVHILRMGLSVGNTQAMVAQKLHMASKSS
ncbi:mannose-ethanolamine phosphotransferase gpi13 [Coemansia sp. RSA 2526]|nr:mannose-ethanolamine phosphotransferase gpi13 [Coemansia sp. RSA 2526]